MECDLPQLSCYVKTGLCGAGGTGSPPAEKAGGSASAAGGAWPRFALSPHLAAPGVSLVSLWEAWVPGRCRLREPWFCCPVSQVSRLHP